MTRRLISSGSPRIGRSGAECAEGTLVADRRVTGAGYGLLGKRIYVGNLPFSATEDELRELFERHGAVQSVALINDRETGRPRGFGFVEMADADAQAAIQAVNGKEMGGRALRVNEAQERTQRPRSNSGLYRR